MRRPVVAPRLDALHGIPGMFLSSDRDAFVRNAGLARAMTLDEVVVDEFVRENSWSARIRDAAGVGRRERSEDRSAVRDETRSMIPRRRPHEGDPLVLAVCLASRARRQHQGDLRSRSRRSPRTSTKPVAIAHAGDGSGRLFIALQEGLIVVRDQQGVLPESFLDIRALVSCCGERGLLGLAFHPSYRRQWPLLRQLHRPRRGYRHRPLLRLRLRAEPCGPRLGRHPAHDPAAVREPQWRAAQVRTGRLPVHRHGGRRLWR